MEKAFRTYGCGNTAPIRSPFGYLKPPEPAASDNRLIFSRDERSTLCTEHTNRKRGNPFLADRGKAGEANHRPTQANAKRGPHLPLCFEESTTRLDRLREGSCVVRGREQSKQGGCLRGCGCCCRSWCCMCLWWLLLG